MLCIFTVWFCNVACISPHVSQLLPRSQISLVMSGQYIASPVFQIQYRLLFQNGSDVFFRVFVSPGAGYSDSRPRSTKIRGCLMPRFRFSIFTCTAIHKTPYQCCLLATVFLPLDMSTAASLSPSLIQAPGKARQANTYLPGRPRSSWHTQGLPNYTCMSQWGEGAE